MREISPAHNATVDEYLETLSGPVREIINSIRDQKAKGLRHSPSMNLIDTSKILTSSKRRALLDKIASLVDENLSGRSDMCVQYASLLGLALGDLGFSSRVVSGQAIYFDANDDEIFRWEHSWVRVGIEVIDGNIDCLEENPVVPSAVRISPYWGPIASTPRDRTLRRTNAVVADDSDVDNTWWPDLKQWLSTEFKSL